MEYNSANHAWAFSRAKDAALFFDAVNVMTGFEIDLNNEVDGLLNMPGVKELAYGKPYRQGDKPHFVEIDDGLFVVGRTGPAVLIAGVKEMYVQFDEPPPELPFDTGDSNVDLNSALRALMLSIESELTPHTSLVLPSGTDDSAGTEEVALSLMGLKLIDTSKMPWSQIIEIRRDKESMKKLRNLRLFFFEKYAGKDEHFVSDDLARRIDEYLAEARKWDADIREGSLAMLLGNEVKASAVGAVTALMGRNVPLALAAATPLFFQLAKTGLEIRKKRRDARFKLDNNPVSYLVEVKNSQHAELSRK